MRPGLFFGLLALGMVSLSAQASAADTPATAEVHQLQTVTVSGLQPGPGLWKVSRGDHVLWILGTVAPVPKRMQWYSPKAELALAQSQELIGVPGIGATVGFSSMFKLAFAMPALLRARKNPDGKTLRDVLPAELHARWSKLKQVYLGDDEDLEEWRPVFAAAQLYEAALKRAGLEANSGVGRRIGEIAEKNKIKQTSTAVVHQIKDPRGLAKSFAKAEVDEVACFASMLDRLDSDVAQAVDQSNAWAVGDIAQLSRLIRDDNMASCYALFANTEAARSIGMQDAEARSELQWLQAVDAALLANRSTFATLPVRKLLQANGLLTKLQARGYSVLAPE